MEKLSAQIDLFEHAECSFNNATEKVSTNGWKKFGTSPKKNGKREIFEKKNPQNVILHR